MTLNYQKVYKGVIIIIMHQLHKWNTPFKFSRWHYLPINKKIKFITLHKPPWWYCGSTTVSPCSHAVCSVPYSPALYHSSPPPGVPPTESWSQWMTLVTPPVPVVVRRELGNGKPHQVYETFIMSNYHNSFVPHIQQVNK